MGRRSNTTSRFCRLPFHSDILAFVLPPSSSPPVSRLCSSPLGLHCRVVDGALLRNIAFFSIAGHRESLSHGRTGKVVTTLHVEPLQQVLARPENHPRRPPKDEWYRQASASTLSLAPSSYAPSTSTLVASNAGTSHDALRVSTDNIGYLPSSSQQDLSRSRSPTPSTGTMTPSASGHSSTSASHSSGSSFKKGFAKLFVRQETQIFSRVRTRRRARWYRPT